MVCSFPVHLNQSWLSLTGQLKYLLKITTGQESSVEFPQVVHLTYLIARVYLGDVFKRLPISQAISVLRHPCDQIHLNLSQPSLLVSCFESISIFFIISKQLCNSFQCRMSEKSQHENSSQKYIHENIKIDTYL